MLTDSLNSIYKQPLQYRLFLRKPNGEDICTLPEHQGLEHFTSLKETDTLDFQIPYYLDGEINTNFDKIRTDYQVYMQLQSEETEVIFLEHNFKIISTTNHSTEDGKLYKDISCKSLEIDLQKKFLMAFKGSKVIYRSQSEINSWTASETYPTKQSFIESGILNVITNLCPSWSIDESNIDSDINSLYRYFEVDSVACLDFLLGEVQNSFLCLFEFDTIHKKIGCRNLTHLGTDRGFFISENRFIKSHTEEVNADDVVTRLYIYGKEQINIRSVNPTGEEYILDLSYYRNSNYMSQSLLTALDNYDALLKTKETEFATLLASLNTYTSQLSVKKSELELLKADLKVLETQLQELIAEEASLTAKNAEITAKNNQISSKESEMSVINTNITDTNHSIETLQSQILMANNFTMAQISELDQFIKDKETTDDTIITSKELFEEGKKIISRINQPSVAFDIDIIDLFSIVEEQMEWNKVKIGDIGTLKYDQFGTDIQLRLLAYTHNYENNSLKLTFANRNNINDTNMFADQLKSTQSTTSSLDIQKYKFLDYVNHDKSAILTYINSFLDLGTQSAVAGTNNSVTIDERGITLANPAYPQKQVRLNYQGIYLTSDGWQTSKWALTADGLNAQILRSIIGEFCTVKAENIILNDDGSGLSEVGIKVTHVDGSYTSMQSDGFKRYVPTYTYNETPTGTPNKEDFSINNTIEKLQSSGWSFINSYTIESNHLILGNYDSNGKGSTSVYKQITKDNASCTITYLTSANQGLNYLIIDNETQYQLSNSSTANEIKTYSITLSKGYHHFEIVNIGYYMQVNSIVFEQAPVTYTQVGVETTGNSYNYLVEVGEGTTGKLTSLIDSTNENLVPDVYIQLPDKFKGKQFKVNVFLQDTGNDNSSNKQLSCLQIKVMEIDYTNAIVRVRGRMRRTETYWVVTTTGNGYNISFNSWHGLDFTYIATC